MEKEKLRILVLSQYFWPENFRINDLTKFLIKKKHEVEILTGLPNYPVGRIFDTYKSNKERYNRFFKSKIYRVNHYPRKSGSIFYLFINFITFFFSALYFSIIKLRKKNYDYIIVFGTSPITTALIGINLSFFTRSKVVLWVLDLWPEVLKDLKILNDKWIYNRLKNLINYIYSKSDLILCQSENFYKKIKTSSKKIIFYTWPEDTGNYKKIKKKSKNFDIVFAGNMGQAQNLDSIINALKKMNKKEITWHFIGGGRHKDKLLFYKEKYNLTNLKFYPYQSISKLKKFYIMADVLLLPLVKGQATSNTIPGKFQTYILYKKPILCHANGIVSDYVKNYKIGLCSEPNDINKLIENVEIFYQAKKKKQFKKLIQFSNFNKLSKKFEKNKILNNFELTLKQFKIIKTIEIIKLSNLNKIKKKNFILSALNLAFLGSFAENKIKLNKNLICWMDGIMPIKIFNINTPKIPGRTILSRLKLNKNYNEIQVIGNLSQKNKRFLENKFKNFKIKHISLPYGNENLLKKKLKNRVQNGIIFMTLPTPKQEMLAQYLSQKLKKYKIYCFGAAINMLSGEEPPAPKAFEENFEFLWRLRFDTKRRLIRLFRNLIYFFYGFFINKFKIELKSI